MDGSTSCKSCLITCACLLAYFSKCKYSKMNTMLHFVDFIACSSQVGVVGADGLRFLAFSETVLRFLALKMTVLRFPSL